ncbi:hypothetical protein B296_00039884 [Ensete ventricosum]|uniref:Uncharacterized protein n=1 Tax=Ensete ventricosum TaxID=4639 RepID=A0A426YT49_ENSVE|nr:hypothetical protein B296_00039884 [Ensete ventricosum]
MLYFIRWFYSTLYGHDSGSDLEKVKRPSFTSKTAEKEKDISTPPAGIWKSWRWRNDVAPPHAHIPPSVGNWSPSPRVSELPLLIARSATRRLSYPSSSLSTRQVDDDDRGCPYRIRVSRVNPSGQVAASRSTHHTEAMLQSASLPRHVAERNLFGGRTGIHPSPSSRHMGARKASTFDHGVSASPSCEVDEFHIPRGGRLGGAALSVDNHRPVDAVVACGPKDSERAWEQVTLTRDRETEGVAWDPPSGIQWEGLAFLGRRLAGAWAGSWGRFLFDRIRVGTARSDCLDGYAGPIGCLILC